MKIFLWVGVVLSSFSLLSDSIVLFDSFFRGEGLHPQLAEHWPMNVIAVGVFVYFLNKSYKAKELE